MYKTPKNNFQKYLLENKNIYLIASSSNFQDKNEFYDKIALALKNGVKMVQLKENNKTTKEIIEEARVIRELCSIFEALFIINDRADITKITLADGIHLEQDSMDIKNAREILNENAIMGFSADSREEVLFAQDSGASYIVTEYLSQNYFAWLKENAKIPFYIKADSNLIDIKKNKDFGIKRIAISDFFIQNYDIKKIFSMYFK